MKKNILLFILFFLGILYLKNINAQDYNSIKLHHKKVIEQLKNQNIIQDNPQANKNTVAIGNWSSGATWNGGTVPKTGDNITILNNVTLDIIDSAISIGSLTINAGVTLTMNPETNLIISNNTIILGTLLVKAGTLYGTWVYPMGNFSITGGTFNSSASNTHLDFVGTANQTITNLGTITSPLTDFNIDNSHNVTLAGSLTVDSLNINIGNLVNSILSNVTIASGGMLNRGDGTIAVTPVGTLYDLMYTNTLPANSGPELQNNTVIRDLTINSADNVTMTANATVNRNFIVNGGNLNIAAFTLTLKGGITAGGFFGSLTGGATSKITLGGSGSVTLPDIQTQQLKKLTINRTANDQITLGGNLQITDTLDIEIGNINTNGNTFTLGTGGTAATVGTLIYNAGANTGIITGSFTRWFAKAINASPVKFPMGDVTANVSPRMVTVQFTVAPTTAGTLTAQYISGDPGNINTTPILDGTYSVDTYSKVGYWQVSATNLAGGTYTITIYPVGFIGMNVYAQLRVLKRPASGNLWTLQGAQVSGTSTPTASRSGLSGFSQFALGGNTIDNPLDGPLPVELASFTSNLIGRNVDLKWTTATELNNSGFEIQKQYSISGTQYSDWSKIAFIKGNGTINTPTDYTFQDNNLNMGKYKYRLKQIDYNGNFEYHVLNGVVEINAPSKFDVSQNYPNPFNPTTKIDYQVPENGNVKLIIYDMVGREIKNLVNENEQAGFYSIEFNAGNLASGMYIYRLSFDGGNNKLLITKKMLLIK